MIHIRRPDWGILLTLLLAAGLWGCGSQPPAAPDPFAALEAMEVRIVHAPPPNAKFIAKIVFSSGAFEGWERACNHYLRTQAVKLGGNVVVPGVEIDWKSRRFYTDRGVSHPVILVQPMGQNHIIGPVIPARINFWNNVYYCPE
jgi:hypothetical protein